MAVQFSLRQTTTIPLEVDGISPDLCRQLSTREIEHLPIQHGNRQLPLAEFFTVRGDPTDEIHVWSGDLRSVHWLGAKLTRGTIHVEGQIGRHLGSGMLNGAIHVSGSAGDWAGAEMRGGLLEILGDAGDCIGGAYRGSRRGMTGGRLLVHGNAGHEVGRSMRRGIIGIGGQCGDLIGCYMWAGTILVFGESGIRHGASMRRGTIALFSSKRPPLLPTFKSACRYRPLAMSLILRQLTRWHFPIPASLDTADYDLFHGDLLTGGRGELLLVA